VTLGRLPVPFPLSGYRTGFPAQSGTCVLNSTTVTGYGSVTPDGDGELPEDIYATTSGRALPLPVLLCRLPVCEVPALLCMLPVAALPLPVLLCRLPVCAVPVLLLQASGIRTSGPGPALQTSGVTEDDLELTSGLEASGVSAKGVLSPDLDFETFADVVGCYVAEPVRSYRPKVLPQYALTKRKAATRRLYFASLFGS